VCRNYLRNKRVPTSELTPEELISEVWQKLLGTVALDIDEAEKESAATSVFTWPSISAMRHGAMWLVRHCCWMVTRGLESSFPIG
jgi:hypothetical protein